MIISYKGQEFWDKLHTLNAVQLRDVVINYDSPIVKEVEDADGINYIESLQNKKSDFGAWWFANRDEISPILGTTAGVVTTIATGGAAAPFIPLFGIGGSILGTGGVKGEKEIIVDLQQKIYNEINKKNVENETEMFYIYGLIIIIIISIILYLYE